MWASASRVGAGRPDAAWVVQVRNFVIDKADEFSYKDPVDGSVSEHQGIRFLFSDGSRVIFRLSGVASTKFLPKPPQPPSLSTSAEPSAGMGEP